MPVVGFIGFGVMGTPMAANLVRAGFDVVGYGRSPESRSRVNGVGARVAERIEDAVTAADVVLTMLPDSPQVEEVVLGTNGILQATRDGTVYIDCSTIDPEVSRRLNGQLRQSGLRPLDAPVSGGEAGAIEGTLAIMVGGKVADFEAAMPIFNALGTTIEHVGPDGAGQIVKAANQLVVAGVIEVVAEAIVLLEANGVEVGTALDVLAGGLAGNRILERKRSSMLGHDFKPGFRVDLHHKDMGIVLKAAREAGVTVPVGGLVAQLFAALRAQGYGSLDHSALLLLAEELSGVPRDSGAGDD